MSIEFQLCKRKSSGDPLHNSEHFCILKNGSDSKFMLCVFVCFFLLVLKPQDRQIFLDLIPNIH